VRRLREEAVRGSRGNREMALKTKLLVSQRSRKSCF
jgi:hypothetical protein